MRTTHAAARTIAARIRAIAPIEHTNDPSTPAGAAVADMDAIERGEWDRPIDADTVAWMIETAIEATAEYTTDGYEDAEARAAGDAV